MRSPHQHMAGNRDQGCTGCTQAGSRSPLAARRAFTIAELLVVISILVLLLGVAAGSLRSLLASSERSLADQQLRVALAAARDLALRNNKDSGAFFLFESGKINIVPAIVVGEIVDRPVTQTGAVRPLAANQLLPEREIFAPTYSASAFTLPAGYSVRGFAPPGTLNDDATNRNGLYDSLLSMDATQALDGNWIFPETSFFDDTQAARGGNRQSFFVRFEARTGNLVMSNNKPVLLIDVANTEGFRGTAPYDVKRIDQADDYASFVAEVLGDAALNPVILPPNALTDAQRLLGDASLDTVLCLPVTDIALYSERSLANAIGARQLNRGTDTLYGEAGGSGLPTEPRFDTALFATAPTVGELQERVNDWINVQASGPPESNARFDARIFSLARYLSQLQEVTP